jgi:hypothetical protein
MILRITESGCEGECREASSGSSKTDLECPRLESKPLAQGRAVLHWSPLCPVRAEKHVLSAKVQIGILQKD